jgi:hypothetical protein
MDAATHVLQTGAAAHQAAPDVLLNVSYAPVRRGAKGVDAMVTR